MLKVIRLAIMAAGTLVFESIIDRVMLLVTEAAGEGAHVQVIEEYTQNRNAFDPVFVREREWIVDGTGDRFWMRLETFVQVGQLVCGNVGAALVYQQEENPIYWALGGLYGRAGTRAVIGERGRRVSGRHRTSRFLSCMLGEMQCQF